MNIWCQSWVATTAVKPSSTEDAGGNRPASDEKPVANDGPPQHQNSPCCKVFAEKPGDEGRFWIDVEAVQRSSEDYLATPIDGRGQPPSATSGANVCPENRAASNAGAVWPKNRILPRRERIANLYGRMHGDSIPFGLEEMPGQGDTGRYPDPHSTGASVWHARAEFADPPMD